MGVDWIKMRSALIEHPKVIAMARHLHDIQGFREWLTPGGALNGQIASDSALRCVTCALLLKVWSGARAHGEFVGDDLVLKHNSIADLDQMAGVPGFGAAMRSVKWVVAKNGVTLPNFKEYNVPMTPAEKQQAYRDRALLKRGNEKPRIVTAREEKSREEQNNPPTPRRGKAAAPPVPDSLRDQPGFAEAWADWLAYRHERRLTCTPRTLTAQLRNLAACAPDIAIEMIRKSIASGWQGLFEPKAQAAKPAAAITSHPAKSVEEYIEDRQKAQNERMLVDAEHRAARGRLASFPADVVREIGTRLWRGAEPPPLAEWPFVKVALALAELESRPVTV